jgi:predicted nuclease of predicted toxin-antitoxin system
VRLLLDHCVPNRVAKLLGDAGHEVIRLRECLPTDSPDPVVIRKADDLDAILVSLNGDFADITAYPPAKHRGIVALQVRNRPETVTPDYATAGDVPRSTSRSSRDGRQTAVDRGAPY